MQQFQMGQTEPQARPSPRLSVKIVNFGNSLPTPSSAAPPTAPSHPTAGISNLSQQRPTLIRPDPTHLDYLNSSHPNHARPSTGNGALIPKQLVVSDVDVLTKFGFLIRNVH
jgi:hypothetical protein